MIRRPQRQSRPGGNEGFTLLEVIVAVTIMGIGIAALAALFSGALRLAGGSRDVSDASIYASQRLEEALLSPEPSAGVSSGAFGEKYRWTMRAEALPAEADIPFRATRIDVTVAWDDAGNERSVDLNAVRWDRSGKDAGAGG